MKKLLALFLLILSLLKIENAKAYDFCVDGIYYNVLSFDDLTVEVTHGDNKYTGTVIVPQTVVYMGRSLSVISIGEKSFEYNKDLVSIKLPEGIQSISKGAFYDSSLQEITIPNSVTHIGMYAFRDCKSLILCQLSNNLYEIQTDAFRGCEALREIYLPASLEHLGSNVFLNCLSLEKIQIGPSLRSIGKEAFGSCSALKTIVIEDGAKTLDCSRDRIFPSGRRSFQYFYLGRNVIFNPNPWDEYDNYIEEFIIGKSVTTIDKYFHFTGKITSLCSEPPSLPGQDNATYLNVEVIVPKGSLSAYKSAESWKYFWNIHEEGSSTEEPNTCNMPTIEYINGKLCISSTTPDSKCYYSIKDNDIVNNSIVDGDIELSATYTITAYATAEGYERSSLSTATLCWIEGSFETDGIETPFVSRKAAIIAVENGVVSVSGLDEGCLVQSISIDGRIIDRSVAKDGIATLNAEQCAIIKIADKSIKIVERK